MAETLSAMMDVRMTTAYEMELVPYYLYRQKNIAGNFENVGYAKVDKAGIYNILIMEEKQTITCGRSRRMQQRSYCRRRSVPGSRNGKTTNLIRDGKCKKHYGIH